MKDYLALLEHSYLQWSEFDSDLARCDYIAEYVMGLSLYCSEMSDLFASRACEVAKAINNNATFDYIEDSENHQWFLVMLNYPFFSERINWGTSIRAAFWTYDAISLEGLNFFDGEDQISGQITFNRKEWESFIDAMCVFVGNALKIAREPHLEKGTTDNHEAD